MRKSKILAYIVLMAFYASTIQAEYWIWNVKDIDFEDFGLMDNTYKLPAPFTVAADNTLHPNVGISFPAFTIGQTLPMVSTPIMFTGLNTGGVYKPYAGIVGRITDNTVGSEAGELWFYTNDGNTYYPMMVITRNGEVILSPTAQSVSSPLYGLMTLERGDSSDEGLLSLMNITTPAVTDTRVWISFGALNDNNERKRYSVIRNETTNKTKGAEASQLRFMNTYSGVEGYSSMVLNDKGALYQHRNNVINATDNVSPSSAFNGDSHTYYYNGAASGDTTVNLPVIVTSGLTYNVGTQYTLIAGGNMWRLHPYSGDRISGHSADNTVLSTSSDATITVVASFDKVWAIISSFGTWIDGGQ